MFSARALTFGTIWVALTLYVLALAIRIAWRDRLVRALWTAGCLFYLAHVALAFQAFYRSSHAVAYLETARQTAALFGIDWGGGLYFNYAFTAIWVGDTLWMWLGLDGYRNRPFWLAAAIQIFMAFMAFNATVVFAHGTTRTAGLIATALLIWLATRRKNFSREQT